MLAPLVVSLSLALALGPEVPVGSLQQINAALDQTINSVASNGHDYLALWNDARSSSYGAFYAGHVDATGHPLVATGRKVVESPSSGGRLTWTGDSYLLIYQGLTGFYMQTLDDDGNAVAPATRIDLESTPREIAANADSILVVHQDGAVWVLSRDGKALSKQLLPWPDDLSPIVSLPNGDYAFVTRVNTTTRLNVVSATTHLLQQISLGDLGTPWHVNATASDDGRIFVTWLATSGDQVNVCTRSSTQGGRFSSRRRRQAPSRSCNSAAMSQPAGTVANSSSLPDSAHCERGA